MWSGPASRGGQSRLWDGMAGRTPAWMGASKGPDSWVKEILLLLVGREKKQGLIWEKADVGGG